MVLFIAIPVNYEIRYTGRIRPKLVTQCNSNGIKSRTLWWSWNEPEIVVFKYHSFPAYNDQYAGFCFAALAGLRTNQQI